MKNFISSRFLVCGFLLLFLGCANTYAAEIKNAIKHNPKSCLGDQIPYKNYERSIMQIIQQNLEILYKGDPEWEEDAAKHGQPLHDGLMGPVTWSWMQHFCANFATQHSKNMEVELPEKVERMANFAKRYEADTNILISDDFLTWIKRQQDPTQKDNYTVLYQGTDAELLALVERYKNRNQVTIKPAPVVKKIPEQKKFNTFYLYSLTKKDLEELKRPNVLPLLIKALIDKPFNDETEVNAAITAAFKDQPAELQEQIKTAVNAEKSTVESYQLNQEILEGLANTGLSALQIAELDKLPKDTPETQEQFKEHVAKAIDDAELLTDSAGQPIAKIGNAQGSEGNSASSEASVASVIASSFSSVGDSSEQKAKKSLAVMRVLNASKKTSYMVTGEDAIRIGFHLNKKIGVSTLPEQVVNVLKVMQDIEYPEGELLHAAARNKIQKSLNACLLNRVNAVDAQTKRLTEKERSVLQEELKNSGLDDTLKEAIASLFANYLEGAVTPHQVCTEAFENNLSLVYDALIRPAIDKVYRKVAPPYSGKKIQWDGSKCGCIPDAIASTAYGFYRYWDIADQPQLYDFSTFSRVGYYGFSFNGNGQITQTNTTNQAKTLLNEQSDEDNEFINVARNYGSKVDWVIEKDWNDELTGNDAADTKKITFILEALRLNIIHLLSEPLRDSLSVVKPILTLGLSNHPHKGDGVTLYFKNYPNTADQKAIFNDFFKNLKSDLNNLSKKHNRLATQGENYYLNIVANQTDFLAEDAVFSNANLKQLVGVRDNKIVNMTPLEMQNKAKSLFLVLLNDPYYNSLDDIYAMTSETNRDIVVPVMFMNHKDFHSADESMTVDERQKNLSYIQESFGGGGLWPMPAWDKKGAEEFNHHLATQFALGYPQSIWTEKLCGYRWIIISVMNIWLCLALIVVVLAFYVFPLQCRNLPVVLEVLLHPVSLMILVVPPLIIWITLLIVDHHFPFLCVPSVIAVVLIGLTLWAGVNYVKSLRQRKPNRNLLQAQKLPSRSQLAAATKRSAE